MKVVKFLNLSLGCVAVGIYGAILMGAGRPDPAPNGTCRDRAINDALRQFNLPINGFGTQGNCDPRLYNNGQWRSNAELFKLVDESSRKYPVGVCRDAWVGAAVERAYGRKPVGYGEWGDCNSYLYGGGQWGGQDDLLRKVTAVKTGIEAAGLQWESNGRISGRPPIALGIDSSACVVALGDLSRISGTYVVMQDRLIAGPSGVRLFPENIEVTNKSTLIIKVKNESKNGGLATVPKAVPLPPNMIQVTGVVATDVGEVFISDGVRRGRNGAVMSVLRFRVLGNVLIKD